MAWAKIASGSAIHSGHVATVTIDSTGADLLLVAVTAYSTTDTWSAFSDNKGNTWTQLTGGVGNGGVSNLMWGWCKPTSVGASHSFTFNGTYNYCTIFVQAWSGAHASPFDQQAVAADAVDGTSRDTGSLTPAVANSLCLSACAISKTNAVSGIAIGSSFTLQDHQDSTSFVGGGSASKESSSAENPSWSWTGSNKAVAGLAIFKPAAGGGGGSTPRSSSRMSLGMGR